MAFTLKNFEKNISSKIIQRGLEYFENGQVQNTEKIAPGKWMAEVIGTKNYYVEVKTHRSAIKEWDCNCPYDHGIICKHVVATFYAVAEDMLIEKEISKRKPKKENINKIFEQVSKKDLEEFIRIKFKRNSSFKSSFLAHFADFISDDFKEQCKIKVINIINSSQINENYYTAYNSSVFNQPIKELINSSKKMISINNLTDSLTLSKIILENVSNISQLTDDNDESSIMIIEDCFDLISDISQVAPPMMKDKIFNYCVGEYSKAKYDYLGVNSYFLDLLTPLISNQEQENEFMKLINSEIKSLKDYESRDYSIIAMINKKIDFLNINHRENEVEEIIKENIEYFEFRTKLIRKNIKDKDYIEAKRLVKEGIRSKKTPIYNHDTLYDYLLEIAQKTKNKKEIRSISEKLFFEFGYKIDYYRILKKTYNEDEWIEQCEALINKIKGGKSKLYRGELITVLNIYVEENYNERLLKNLIRYNDQIDLVNRFAFHLKDIYPNEILDIYEKAIKNYAKNTGRSIYHDISTYLNKIKKIKGGNIRVSKIIEQFRKQYKNRRAMMEILNNDFPNTIPLKAIEKKENTDYDLKLF